MQIDHVRKFQHIPGLPRIWRYCFTSHDQVSNTISKFTTSLHPDSLLHVMVGDHSFHCLKDALNDLGYSRDAVVKTVRGFYEDHLGIALRCRHDHVLVGLPYYTEWIDVKGERREIYGKITECWSDQFKLGDNLTFTIQYDENLRNMANRFALTKLQIPECQTLSEELAWSGYIAWRKVEITNINTEVQFPPFQVCWIIPGTRYKEFDRGEPIPSIIMTVGGYLFRLFTKASGIANAGLGLFVHISILVVQNHSDSVFEFPAGQLIDLGVYAPCTDEECKIEQVVVMKNFLMHDFAESYSFAKASRDTNDFDLFDVTKDDKPALTKAAAENLLVFANESDGKSEVPSLVCRYDAEGAIHYLMGHDEERSGPLTIPLNQDFELKVFDDVSIRFHLASNSCIPPCSLNTCTFVACRLITATSMKKSAFEKATLEPRGRRSKHCSKIASMMMQRL